jgi:hypothetical protein
MIVFFWRNITPERSCRTGEAERVRWVYEWGRGFESGAKDATVLFFCEDGSTPISHHLAVDPYLSYDRITITGLPPPYPRYAIDFHMPALKVCQPCVPWGRGGEPTAKYHVCVALGTVVAVKDASLSQASLQTKCILLFGVPQ